MKKKKLVSVLTAVCMAFAMVFGLGTSVFAQTTSSKTQSLTIKGLENGVKVDVYKIIDLNVDDGGHYDNPVYSWNAPVSDWLKTNDTYKGYIDTNNGVTDEYIDLKDSDESAQLPDMNNKVTAFFQVMAQQLRTSEAEPTKTVTATNDSATVEGLTMGSYLVLASSIKDSSKMYYATVHNVLPTKEFNLDQTSEITMKHKMITIDKEADDQNVSVGDTVSYTITADIPVYPNNVDTIHYVIGDKLSEGLTFNQGSVKVAVGDTLLNKDTDYTLNEDATDKATFTVTMEKATLMKYQGQQIKVTYTATVNDKAVVNPDNLKNNAYLEFNNDPFNSNDHTTTTTEEQVYTYNIDLTKVGTEANDVNGLAGAKFKLMSEDKSTVYKFKMVNNEYYVFDENGSEELVSGENGKLVIKGLDAGTYVLKETQAPSGYVTPSGEITITLVDTNADGTLDEGTTANGVGTSESTAKGLTLAFKLTNSTPGDLDLPVTGGTGTMMFTIGGLTVMAGAVLLFVRNKKRTHA